METALHLNVSVGGNGAGASDGGAVTVDNVGNIVTVGVASHGIMAQSIGGGGGDGGYGGQSGSATGLSSTDLQIVVGGKGGSSWQWRTGYGSELRIHSHHRRRCIRRFGPERWRRRWHRRLRPAGRAGKSRHRRRRRRGRQRRQRGCQRHRDHRNLRRWRVWRVCPERRRRRRNRGQCKPRHQRLRAFR